jgi:hypothetical protein
LVNGLLVIYIGDVRFYIGLNNIVIVVTGDAEMP